MSSFFLCLHYATRRFDQARTGAARRQATARRQHRSTVMMKYRMGQTSSSSTSAWTCVVPAAVVAADDATTVPAVRRSFDDRNLVGDPSCEGATSAPEGSPYWTLMKRTSLWKVDNMRCGGGGGGDGDTAARWVTPRCRGPVRSIPAVRLLSSHRSTSPSTTIY